MTPPPAKKAKQHGEGDPFETLRAGVAASVAEYEGFNAKRVKLLGGFEDYLKGDCKSIAYYMHRDQRVQDNWALVYAQQLAMKHSLPLHVVTLITTIHPRDPGATVRTLQFCFDGLQEVAEECKQLNISYHMLLDQGGENPGNKLADWMLDCGVGCLVTDFSALRQHRGIVQQIVDAPQIEGRPIYQVDAHNVVPVTVTSDKQEYAARTIRNKINSKLPEFLKDFPPITSHPHGDAGATKRHFAADVGVAGELKEDWDGVLASMELDTTVQPVEKFKGGTKAGYAALESFITQRIKHYNDKRNDPNTEALSDLSPWFHIGAISVARAVLSVRKRASSYSSTFIEESIVRRELSDNFCYYNQNYGTLKGATEWAQKTLDDHRNDKREYVYTKEQFVNAETHDDLWNAAQIQLTKEGKMHGFMRMYWAKKVLEWTESPEMALEVGLYLNDRYSLDGCDANGVVGVMWSVCGVHDQGWGERPVFGKIRFMNYAGCKRKFDIDQYIARYGGKVYNASGEVEEKPVAAKKKAPAKKNAVAAKKKKTSK